MGTTRVRAFVAAVVATLLAVGVIAARPIAAADGPTLSVGDQSGLERDTVTGSVFVPITLSEPATEPVVVSYWTADGTATGNVDYRRWGTPTNPRTVTIPTGAVQTQVNVPVFADSDVEGDETFTVTATATGGDVVLGDDTGTATIIDADAVSGANPAITVSNPTIVEGNQDDRLAQFLVHLSRAPATNVTITYTTSDGTAVAGTDYKAKLPGTVVFAPGQISKTIDVAVLPNTTADGARDLTLDVTVTGGSPVEELNMAGSATIIDDDTAAPVPCPPGFFNTTDGNEPCTPAPPGFFVDSAAALAATPCALGRFQDEAGQTSCLLAPIGTFVDTTAAVAATECDLGTFQDQLGQTSCQPAPPGKFVDVTGAAEATDCGLGTFQDQAGQTECQFAPIGTYVDVTGATEATDCPPGTTTEFAGATSVDDCVEPLLALAYTDTDGIDGYTEGVDVLISRLIDSNGDGLPSAGDLIETDRFPNDPQRSGFGEFQVKEWTVESVLAADSTQIRVTAVRGDFPPYFSWYQRPDFDLYVETEWDLVAQTRFQTYKLPPFGCPSTGNLLQIQYTQSMPDYLQSAQLCQAPPDGALVTVEVDPFGE